jgi:hypothetical protein
MRNFGEICQQYNLTPEEITQCQNYIIAIKMRKLGLDPNKVMGLINNYPIIIKAINILNYHIS